jgi:hypothetical protein
MAAESPFIQADTTTNSLAGTAIKKNEYTFIPQSSVHNPSLKMNSFAFD